MVDSIYFVHSLMQNNAFKTVSHTRTLWLPICIPLAFVGRAFMYILLIFFQYI